MVDIYCNAVNFEPLMDETGTPARNLQTGSAKRAGFGKKTKAHG